MTWVSMKYESFKMFHVKHCDNSESAFNFLLVTIIYYSTPWDTEKYIICLLLFVKRTLWNCEIQSLHF